MILNSTEIPVIQQAEVLKVGDLLTDHTLCIPVYQRPYKWTLKNVSQLIDDIVFHKDKPSYRLGTVIVHFDSKTKDLNIVDGQQRTITLLLIVKAVLRHVDLDDIENKSLRDRLKELKSNEGKDAFTGKKLISFDFKNEISILNIQNNYRDISRLVSNFDEKTIGFLLDKCEVIFFKLSDISEAFQFFDSQNARGKDLEPHDLLKAYHLREFPEKEMAKQKEIVETWENMKSESLSDLFAEYLFRIKGWSKGHSSRYFTKDNTDLFKGINIEKIDNFPYTEIIRIAHFYVDRYNNSYERNIDFRNSDYPFQLDQTIINGRRFFEMVTHYKKVFDEVMQEIQNLQLTPLAKEILDVINTYDSRYRIGDQYVRNIFNCALVYYYDKFGKKDIDRAIEKIFIWAYSLRLRHQLLQLATVDNYAISSNIFRKIRDSHHSSDFLSITLNPVERLQGTKIKELVDLFKKMKYYYGE